MLNFAAEQASRYVLMCISHSGDFGFQPFSPLITDILCDLSLVVALTHDFVIATRGPVSSKHTLHPHCLPVCISCLWIISASCALKFRSPPLAQLGTRTSPLHVHFTLSGIKAETARLAVASLPVYMLIRTQRRSCRAAEHLHKSAHSTPLHHTLPCYFSALHCHFPFIFMCVFLFAHRKCSAVDLQQRTFLVEMREKEL